MGDASFDTGATGASRQRHDDASMGDASMDAICLRPGIGCASASHEQPPGPRRIPSIVTIGWLVLALVVASVIGTLVLAPSAVMSVCRARRVSTCCSAPRLELTASASRACAMAGPAKAARPFSAGRRGELTAPLSMCRPWSSAPRRRANLEWTARSVRAARGRGACAVLAADPIASEQCPQRQGAFRQGRVAWLKQRRPKPSRRSTVSSASPRGSRHSAARSPRRRLSISLSCRS